MTLINKLCLKDLDLALYLDNHYQRLSLCPIVNETFLQLHLLKNLNPLQTSMELTVNVYFVHNNLY